jgi:hypothetical protein
VARPLASTWKQVRQGLAHSGEALDRIGASPSSPFSLYGLVAILLTTMLLVAPVVLLTVVLVSLGAYMDQLALLAGIVDIQTQNLLPGHPFPAARFRHASEVIINDRHANPRAVGRSILEICPLRPPFRDRSFAAHSVRPLAAAG